MSRSFLLSVLFFALSTPSSGSDEKRSPGSALAAIEIIRGAATQARSAELGRPLPLAAHWNRGERPGGYDPIYQLRLIEKHQPILPWFAMPGPEKSGGYADYAPVEAAAQLGLPISFVGTQWERLLSDEARYLSLPAEQNPNVVDADGKVLDKVSPFGPVEHWREVGRSWTSSPLMREFQKRYPDPPLVLFVSNNEHRKLRWHEVEEDYRYLQGFGHGRSDEFKRKVVGDGWIERYRALHDGMREGLENPAWQDNARFVGYSAFGMSAFGRWSGWERYALHTEERFDPWPVAWDGASVSYYVNHWDRSTDYRVRSPQIEGMNWVFMLEEAYQQNPDFWLEMSTWDGYAPGEPNDKRLHYAEQGQSYTPERYGGMVRFGMWLLRPRVVREYRHHWQTVEDTGAYFDAVLEAVGEVHRDEDLRRFWRLGELVPNPSSSHPYRSNVPKRYESAERWFLLDAERNPEQPWTLGTEIPVFSLALVLGEAPNRRWLVYVFSPISSHPDVSIELPGFGSVKVSSDSAGGFFVVDESTRKARGISNERP
jgi:hypothetical protein